MTPTLTDHLNEAMEKYLALKVEKNNEEPFKWQDALLMCVSISNFIGHFSCVIGDTIDMDSEKIRDTIKYLIENLHFETQEVTEH